MPKFTPVFPMMVVFILTIMLGVASWTTPGTTVPLQEATPTVTSVAPVMPTEHSWIIVDLPPGSTQLQYGAEIYRLVCKACHGDKGQGLTDDWRAQWAPEDQNCWKSKCHGANHPSDGFYMPMSPAVVGPPLAIFETALDLYNFIHTKMPWHNPGSMTQKESWSVTAYILEINNVDPGPELTPDIASQLRLRKSDAPTMFPTSPASVSATESIPVHSGEQEKTNGASLIWIAIIAIGSVLMLLAIFILGRRSTH